MPIPSRALGSSDISVSAVGLGCNNFGQRVDLRGTRAVVDAALAEGITLFDTADTYGGFGRSETFLGEVLEGRRGQVVLATKFGWDRGDGKGPRGSRAYIREAVEGSLRRLRTGVIELYWYHVPDGETSIVDTLAALDELIRAGKIRAIGASNFTVEQVREADAAARANGLTAFVAIQNQYSLLMRDAEREVLPLCEQLGLGFVPYFPLASGLLTGKYRRNTNGPQGARLSGMDEIATDEQFDLVESLERYGRERDLSIVDVAIGALLAHPAVSSVIAGATKPQQVRANASAALWSPSEEDLAALAGVLGSPVR